MKTIFKLTIVVITLIFSMSCDSKRKDDNFWKKKLCEGYWERTYKSMSYGHLTTSFKFYSNGKFVTKTVGKAAGINDEWSGYWKLFENENSNNDIKRKILFDGSSTGHVDFEGEIIYQSKKYELTNFHGNGIIICDHLGHYSDGGKFEGMLIDKE